MAPRRNPGQKVDDLTAQVTRLYADAEQVILQRIASSLGRGMASPQWMEYKLLELQLIQSRLRGEMAGLATKSASEITRVLTTAYNLGQGDAIVDLHNAGLGYAFKQGAVSGVNQLNALLQETTTSVLAQHQRILRSVDDIYRQAISAATPLQLAGVITRKDAVQRALNTFADAGISGFTDRAGRKWNLTSYTDMATRTAARRAQVEGHANQLAAHDQNLVYVSDHAGECELCRPFEGKVLALVGDGTRTTLDEAKARGVFHPGCRHTIGLYLPGVSNLKHEPDPEGYAARQQQRGIERNIRKWKNRESVALDPATKARARAKVRAHQAQMRDHLEKNPYLKRQPDRESLGWAQSRAKVGQAYPVPNRPFHPLAEPKPITVPKPTAKEAVAWYSQDMENYLRVNRTLRAGTPLTGTDLAMKDALLRGMKPLGSSKTLWRGTSMDSLGQVRAGSTITEKGFMSTSSDRFISEDFIDQNKAFGSDTAMLEIRAGKGTKVFEVPNELMGQDEWLLPPGTNLHVTSVRTHPEYGKLITAEIRPAGAPAATTATRSLADRIAALEKSIASERKRAASSPQPAVRAAASANVRRMTVELQKMKR